jgi:hypothetical protein
MPSLAVWLAAGMLAGSILQAAAVNAERRFRADPQPDRAGAIRFWGLVSGLALLLVFGGAFAFFFFKRAVIGAFVAVHLPDWATPLSTILVPFALAFVLWQAAKPLATILFGRPVENPVPKRQNYGAHTPWFAGFNHGRTYKVFLTDDRLCGAHVGGAIDNDGSPNGNEDPASWVATSLATLYDRIDVTSPQFLALDDDNFHFAYRDIAEVGYQADKRWLQPSVPHSGRLFLTLASGSEYEFLLLGEFDANALVHRISEAAARIRSANAAP